MDLNLIRSSVTLLAFIVFIAIVVRVWRSSNRERFAEAAALPFADEPDPSPQPSPPRTGARGPCLLPLPLAGEGRGEGFRVGYSERRQGGQQ